MKRPTRVGRLGLRETAGLKPDESCAHCGSACRIASARAAWAAAESLAPESDAFKLSAWASVVTAGP